MFTGNVHFLQAIQKGNMEGARIHGENAIRQKNQVMNKYSILAYNGLIIKL